jgi:inorganic pyrophosphatase
MDYESLPAWGDEGAVHVVIEAPRGCGAKIKYEPKLGAFSFGRALPLGLTYPFDWGFVPSTQAEDGDPLDALVLTDVSSYPGVVVPCRLLGAVLLDQKDDESRKRERNDRIVAVPLGSDRFHDSTSPEDLSKRLREEIEHFFLDTTFFSQKDARILGWKGPKYAADKVRKALRNPKKR